MLSIVLVLSWRAATNDAASLFSLISFLLQAHNAIAAIATNVKKFFIAIGIKI